MPTTLYRRGRVHTPDHAAATALVVGSDGRVAWLGRRADGVDPRGCRRRRRRPRWALVLPGFVDAHVHLSHTGMGLRGVDLSGTRSVGGSPAHGRGRRPPPRRPARLRARLAGAGLGGGPGDHGGRAGPGELRRGRLRLARRRPLRRRLQRAGHGVRGRPPRRLAGRRVRDPRREERRARGLRRCAQPRPAPRRRRGGAPRAAAAGVAVLHECGGPLLTSAGDFADVLDLGRRPDLPRTVGYWAEAVTEPEQARALVALHGAAGLAGDLNIDGSIGSHTAHLRGAVRRRRGVHRHGVPVASPTCATTSPRAPWPASRAASTSSATPAWTPCSRATRRRRRSSGSTSCGPPGRGSSTPRWSTPTGSPDGAARDGRERPAGLRRLVGRPGRDVRRAPRCARACRGRTPSPR